jgi:hypothetical protein
VNETVTLYRPVGGNELRLIEATGMCAFPPRLPEQPIFYPVTNEGYVTKIAREWTTRSESKLGFVTRFAVRKSFLDHLSGRSLARALPVPRQAQRDPRIMVEPDNLMLEHLRAIRGEMARMGDYMHTLTVEMTAIRQHLAGVVTIQEHDHSDIASIKVRLERIEKSLDLVD